MWKSLHDAWWRLATQSHPESFSDALVCGALRTGSVVYQAAVTLRNLAYDKGLARQITLPCRVVSVGNLTVGGTGKTACVELISKRLAARGKRVAVLSRGYGGRRKEYWLTSEQGVLRVNDMGDSPLRGRVGDNPLRGQSPQEEGLADEPQLLAHHLDGIPILVGPRRDRTGALACTQFSSDVVVLDDGFQHRRVARDCDIVLVHAGMPLAGWAMLPRGPMREPITALKRAHVVIVTKSQEALGMVGVVRERLRALNPDAAFVTAAHEPVRLIDGATGTSGDLAQVSGTRIGLVSSIGDPEGFEATVRRLNATVLWHQAFPDHHPYQAAEWDAICARAEADRPDALMTTEKDWVRLSRVARGRLPSVPLWILGIEMTIVDGDDALNGRLDRL